VAVGQFVGVLARGGAVGQVDVELAGAGAERGLGGAVRAHALARGFAHHRHFVGRLERAVVFQIVDHRLRIVRRVLAERALRLAEDGAARRILGQVRQRVGRLADHDHFEVLDPGAAGRLRHHVPVIEGLQVDQLGRGAGSEDQPAAGVAHQRHPGLELRVDRIRIVAVVEDL
ncbi:hypothetical protein CATMIT_01747, partial [Catenibacterium mitsuokai DSM 15897]